MDTGRDEEAIPTLVDESRVRDLPATARGVRTREALVAAARRVFERDGFLDSKLTDITAEASCSVGTFYTYFDSKEEVFTAVMQAAQDDMMHPGLPRVPDNPGNVEAVFATSLRGYLEAYERNARLMLLLEQVATIDPVFRQLRVDRARAFAERNARRIVWLQRQGLADAGLDPLMTARALSTMVSRMAYYSIGLGEDWNLDDMVATLTRLWLNALGIRPGG